jgi:hypothetical protein
MIGQIRKVEWRLIIGILVFAFLMLARYYWVGRSAQRTTSDQA